MRSRKYGTHPMPPSDRAILMFGNSLSTRLHTRSAAACTMVIGWSVISTSTGASGVVMASFDDEPMCMQMTVPRSSAARQNGSQYGSWSDGCVERCGVLGERDGVAAHVGEAVDLGRGLLGAPDHRQAERDEPAGVPAAPLVDVPVVVGPDHRPGDVVVLGRREEPAREPGHRREAQRPEDAARVHVLDALVDVPAALAHLVEAGRLDAVLLLRASGHGVQADVGDLVLVVVPGERAVGRARVSLGANSWYFAGRCVSNTSGGSTTWSSTLTRIRSSMVIVAPSCCWQSSSRSVRRPSQAPVIMSARSACCRPVCVTLWNPPIRSPRPAHDCGRSAAVSTLTSMSVLAEDLGVA